MMDLTVGKIHGLWYNVIIAPSPPNISDCGEFYKEPGKDDSDDGKV